MMNIIVFTQLFIYTQKPLTHNTIYCFFVYKWLLCVYAVNIHIGWMRIYASWEILGCALSLISSSWLVIPRLNVYIFLMFINIIFHPMPNLTSSCLLLISRHYSSFPSIKKALIHFHFDYGSMKLLITMKPEFHNNFWGFSYMKPYAYVNLINFNYFMWLQISL